MAPTRSIDFDDITAAETILRAKRENVTAPEFVFLGNGNGRIM